MDISKDQEIKKKKREKKAKTSEYYMDLLRSRGTNKKNVLNKDLFEEKTAEVLYWLDRIKNSFSLVISEDEAISNLYTGQHIYIDPRNIIVAPKIVQDGILKSYTTSVVRSLVSEDTVAVDVGSAFGYMGVVCAASLPENTSGIRIHFIEPSLKRFELIEKTLVASGIDHLCKISNYIICSSKPKGRTETSMKSKYYPLSDTDIYSGGLKNLTLDEYCNREKIDKLDLLIVDNEGFEEDLFEGASKTLKKSPDIKIVLEFYKNKYTKPEDLYGKISKKFKNIYVISERLTKIIRITSYKGLVDSLGPNADSISLVISNEEVLL